jgi:hypothetical protein
MSRSSFPNLQTIRRSISHLYSKFGAEFVEGFRTDFNASSDNPRYKGDGLLATQKLASDIVSHFHIPSTTVLVTYSRSLKPPGRVELSSSNEVFVELQEQYRGNFNAVLGILAHEIAHIVLHKSGIEFSATQENEILTDTTAALFGMGVSILNATIDDTEYGYNYSRTRYQHFGYLTPSEFGYIVARRDYIYQRDSSKAIRLEKLVAAYNTGKQQLLREHSARPFRKRPFYQRLFHKRPSNSAFQLSDDIIFPCPRCCKSLRIPSLYKTLAAKCPVCHSSYTCYS